MSFLFALVAAFFAVCGLGLAGIGIGMLVDGETAGLLGLVLGLFTCYGAYPFARAAVRVRRELHEHPLTRAAQQSRRRRVRVIVGASALGAVSAFAWPVPVAVKVLVVVGTGLVLPLSLARDFEPVKRTKQVADDHPHP